MLRCCLDACVYAVYQSVLQLLVHGAEDPQLQGDTACNSALQSVLRQLRRIIMRIWQSVGRYKILIVCKSTLGQAHVHDINAGVSEPGYSCKHASAMALGH